MKSFFEFEILAFVIKECVQIADAVNDEIGLSNMAELLEQEDLIPYLTKEIHLILLKNRD